MTYLKNGRRILRCFKVASGLRINFQKTCVVKIGKGREGEENWAASFRCAKAKLPITYLGLSPGGRPCAKLFWSNMIHRLENRLAPWKRCFLNKGGGLVLFKAVLSSLPIYFISVFEIPVGIAKKIERL
ncbi:hypothetical protein Dsin_008482 [Dipteronia sinensis]|uniref:Reverse transcriptase n=1 Tax=Dipteronia sinensis TaxID=43782 RepID=A0AAE0AQ13_9ROSI|nr:hypothetical protein Dsin_008482 [Dipteronia sinensis]